MGRGDGLKRFSRPLTAALLASLLAGPAWAQDDAQRVAAETGGPADRYVDANFADPSPGSCTVLLSVVRAGDLAKVTGGFQLAVDLKIDLDHPADYTIGMGDNGRSTFAGGALTEMTGAFKDGVLRIPNVPKYFDVEATFGPGSGASAMIHRVCFGPQTTLIYVVDNPDTGAQGRRLAVGEAGRLGSGKDAGPVSKLDDSERCELLIVSAPRRHEWRYI